MYKYIFSRIPGKGVNFPEASTGEITVPAQDTMNAKHFCAGISSSCDRWDGDWIQVRRYPFQPQQLEYGFDETPELRWFRYRIDCVGDPVLLALN